MGVSTATVILIAQRDAPALTPTSVPLVIQADVVTVSPAGRLQDERMAALLNVLMVKTKTGWRRSDPRAGQLSPGLLEEAIKRLCRTPVQ